MKGQIKRILPKPLLEALRNIKGTYITQLQNSFNTYSVTERGKSVLPTKFNWSKPTPLCYIMKEKGTDKALYQGESKHNYTTFYHAAFKNLKDKPIRLFELGLGTTNPNIAANMGSKGTPGASIRGWKEFFPFGEIFGADIDKSILFNEERIKTFFCDQTNSEAIKQMWQLPELKQEFDIILDDGLHQYEANLNFFENSYHKFKVGGIYIIEDVVNTELAIWEKTITNGRSKYLNYKFTLLKVPNEFNYIDNNLILIERIN